MPADCDRRGWTVALTAPVVTEFLIGHPTELRQSAMDVISERFRNLPFDARCVLKAADMMADLQLRRQLKQAGGQKDCVRTDMMILAAAGAASAVPVYTHDLMIRIGNSHGVPAKRLPTLEELRPKRLPPATESQPLFGNGDSEADDGGAP